jgi:single-strand DNA-binding protein
MNNAQVTIVGNLTADPELRFTKSGHSVANLTIASTPRTYNSEAKKWVDGEALFLRASAWRDLGENIAESLTKGQRVIATGKLVQRNYEDKQGEKRSSFELEIEEIGASLKFGKKAPAGAKREKAADPWGGGDDTPPW